MKSKPNETSEMKSNGGNGQETTPFSRPIAVEHIPDSGTDITIEANPAERSALAAWDGLVGIGKLVATFHVAHRPANGFNVSGRLSALITQTCVVSLDPFEAEIAEDINVDFVTPEMLAKAKLEKAKGADLAKPDDEEDDPPDPILDGKIDLGALATEFLALALDPYPRKPGVQFEDTLAGAPEDRESPFAVLRKLDKTS